MNFLHQLELVATIVKSAKNKEGTPNHLTVFINCMINKKITRTLQLIIFNPISGSFHGAFYFK